MFCLQHINNLEITLALGTTYKQLILLRARILGMEFKCMIVFLLQINLTIVISSRMVANDSFSRQEGSVRLERETSYLEKTHAIIKTIQVIMYIDHRSHI